MDVLPAIDLRDGNREVYFNRVSSAGDLAGPDVRLTNTADHSYISSIVFTGSEYGVYWFDYISGNYVVYFTRVTSSGSTIGPDIQLTY